MRQERSLTPLALGRLLGWLDAGTDSQGERYLEMRRRLVAYFVRRNRQSPDELADETLNRIAVTLEKEGTIAVTPQARYCYVVARFVLLEDIRRERPATLDKPWGLEHPAAREMNVPGREEAAALREQRLDCLDVCLQALEPEQRKLVLEYHHGGNGRSRIEARCALAKRLGVTMNALAIRASRIRAILEECVETCRRPGREV